LPRFIYKRYHSFFEKKNHEITKKLLKTGGPYLLQVIIDRISHGDFMLC